MDTKSKETESPERTKVLEHIEKLEKFKIYVHDRLDRMGVPPDPEPERNKEHSCRIEGRLNYVANILRKVIQ